MEPNSPTLQRISRCGIVAAVRVQDASQVPGSVESLLAGGLDVAEIAMSMNGGIRMLESAAALFGGAMLLGAGTVLDAETARFCILAGAQFLVSPSLTLSVIEMGSRYGIPVLCGAMTPTEVVAAWSAGAACVKVFPADALGGPQYIRSLKRVLPHVELMPMGGVSLASANDYLEAGSFALGIGSDLVPPTADRNRIEERAHAFKEVIVNARRGGQ